MHVSANCKYLQSWQNSATTVGRYKFQNTHVHRAFQGWASVWILFTWEKSPVGSDDHWSNRASKLRAGAKYWGCGTAPAVSFQSGLHGPFGTYFEASSQYGVQVIALDRGSPTVPYERMTSTILGEENLEPKPCPMISPNNLLADSMHLNASFGFTLAARVVRKATMAQWPAFFHPPFAQQRCQ